MFGQDKFNDLLLENRYELALREGKLSGSGTGVLEKAIAEAQFVLIGEQHGTVEIPEFTAAVCDLAVPHGFHDMAIETGDLITTQLEKWIQSPDPRGQIAEFDKEFPGALPFYHLREENGLLTHCSHLDKTGRFHLWGLDQEFFGSSRFLLESLLNTKPGKEAEEYVRKLLREDNEAYTRSTQSGRVKDSFMMAVSSEEIQKLRELVAKGGNPKSASIVEAFAVSREIYLKNLSGAGYASNRQRAILMKEAFARRYGQESRDGTHPKVLLKFGSVHMYRGINPLRNNDLGNFVAELAEGQGTASLHIVVMGAKGAEVSFVAPGQPFREEKFDLTKGEDASYAYLKPLLENQLPEGWTLFDFRGLRGRAAFGRVDEKLERFMIGYDVAIIIPMVSPSTEIR
jgi:hypothetical protein